MKKYILSLAILLAIVGVAHAQVKDSLGCYVDTINGYQVCPDQHIGYFPSDNPKSEAWINPIYSSLSSDNPSCKGLTFVIANILYSF